MHIVQEITPRPKLKGGDLVVINDTPYFVIEYPVVALLNATHCNAFANGDYKSLIELTDYVYNKYKDIQVFSKEDYHFKLERRIK